jgi:hypothetical protein
MAASPHPIRLQMLVRPDARNPRGLADLEAALRALGFEVTGTGRASVSARATEEAFSAAFGDVPAASSYMASPAASPRLSVPAPLADYVERINIASPHTVIGRRGGK